MAEDGKIPPWGPERIVGLLDVKRRSGELCVSHHLEAFRVDRSDAPVGVPHADFHRRVGVVEAEKEEANFNY